MTDMAVAHVFRFDPSADAETRWATYSGIPFKGLSVLDVLQHIYEVHDSSLAFRGPCAVNCCKGCTVVINGKPGLACEKRAEVEMAIEPLSKFALIKDLVVDFNIPKEATKE